MQKIKPFQPLTDRLRQSDWAVIGLHTFGGAVIISGNLWLVNSGYDLGLSVYALFAAALAGLGGALLGLTLYARNPGSMWGDVVYHAAVWAGAIAILYALLNSLSLLSLGTLPIAGMLSLARARSWEQGFALGASWVASLVTFYLVGFIGIWDDIAIFEWLFTGALVGVANGATLAVLLQKIPDVTLPRGRLMIGDDGEIVEIDDSKERTYAATAKNQS